MPVGGIVDGLQKKRGGRGRICTFPCGGPGPPNRLDRNYPVACVVQYPVLASRRRERHHTHKADMNRHTHLHRNGSEDEAKPRHNSNHCLARRLSDQALNGTILSLTAADCSRAGQLFADDIVASTRGLGYIRLRGSDAGEAVA